MTLRRSLLPLFALGVAAITGCSHKGIQTPHDNILRYPLLASPTTFDPAMVTDGTTIDMLQQIFEGLVQWTPQNTLAPDLASSWTKSSDGLTYTFHMRKDVTFQDGTPLTASDVKYSITRALLPSEKSPVALAYLGDIVGAADVNAGRSPDVKGIQVPDPYTVVFHIVKPEASWIYTLTYPTAYVVSKKEASQASGELTSDLDIAGAGSGPFKLTRYDPDSLAVLTANAAYWDGAPKIAGMERPVVIDANTRHSMFLSGKLDMVDEQKSAFESDAANPATRGLLHEFPRAATYYIGLNEKTFPPFADVRVRQALAYATDKARIQSIVLKGKQEVAQDLLPNGIPGFDPAFKGIPYDPAKARQLLAAAGYPGGAGFPTIPISYRQSYPDLVQTVDLIRTMWHDNLGINVEARVTEWSVLLSEEDSDKLDCYHIRWAADYLDPQDFYSLLLRSGSSENHVGYANPKYNALCDAADVDQDPADRAKKYREAARIAADEVPLIPLYYQTDFELISPRVHNLEDGLMGHLPYKHTTLAN